MQNGFRFPFKIKLHLFYFSFYQKKRDCVLRYHKYFSRVSETNIFINYSI